MREFMIARSSFVHHTSQTENNSDALHWVNGQIVVYSHIAISKQQAPTTWNQTDGFHSSIADYKRPDIKEYT